MTGSNQIAHRVLALAEDDDVAHARNSLQRVLDVDIQVVRDVLVRKTVVGGIKAGGENEIGVGFGDGDAGVFDFLRQPALRGGNTVLHVDRGDVEVVAGAEDNVDGTGTVVRTG